MAHDSDLAQCRGGAVLLSLLLLLWATLHSTTSQCSCSGRDIRDVPCYLSMPLQQR